MAATATKRGFPKANPAIPWVIIVQRALSGEPVAELSAEYGVNPATLRSRMMRVRMADPAYNLTDKVAKRAASTIVRQQVKKLRPEIEARARAAMQECVTASVDAGKLFVATATERVKDASDRDLSSVSTTLRTGVTVWREALGMGTEGDGSARPVAINLHVGFAQAGEEIDPAIDV